MTMILEKYEVGINDRNTKKLQSEENKECKKLCCVLIYPVTVPSGYYLTPTTLALIKVMLWIIITIT